MSLRAIVVDDEELARQYLLELLEAHPEVEVVATCQNGFEAVKACATHQPDLMFLDIQMPKLDGFEVLELCGGGPRVIFITAYDQYALKAFEVHAVDYLLKPFSPERLTAALDRLKAIPEAARPDPVDLAAASRPPDRFLDRIVVKDGMSVAVIPVDQLDFVRSEDDYISIHSRGKSLLKHQTIQSLERLLDPARFVRIHRTAIVNLERIERIEPNTKDTHLVILSDGTSLPVSKSGYARLRELM